MKLIRPNPRAPRPDDALGRGMDIALTVALFFGLGFFVDRWLGTTPLFMITFTLLAVIGFFISMKYRYNASMEQLEAERAARARDGRAA